MKRNSSAKGRLSLLSVVMVGVLSGALGGVLFSAHLASAQKEADHTRVVIAEEMRIVDKRGRTMAKISSGERGGRLTLLDGRGRVRVMAGIDDLGETFLSFHGRDGEFRLILGTWLEGEPRIVILDEDQEKRVALGFQGGSGPALRFTDSGGNPRLQANLGEEGDPTIVLMDGAQRVRAQLGFTEENDLLFTFQDQTGSPRLGLGVLANGGAIVQMADLRGTPRISIGDVQPDEGGPQRDSAMMLILDEDGRPLWHAP